MKVSGYWVILMVLGTVLMSSIVSSSRNGPIFADAIFNLHADGPKMGAISRKLKENGCNPSKQNKSNAGDVNLDDYHPIDPSPSSKASIKPSPIEHGTPIIPYIPKPLTPAHPSPGGAP